MTLTFTRLQAIKRRRIWLTCRRLSAVVTILILVSQSVLAESVQVSQVVQTINPNQGLVQLRVNTLTQDPASPGAKGSATGENDKTRSSENKTPTTSSLSGIEISSQTPQVGVELVGDAIVEGTVCDCGEILVPGGFAKWPFLFLAAIPLIFVHHDCEDCGDTKCLICDSIVTPTPTPTPSNNTVPEPATLLLFGTGLLAFGAGLRRRYAKAKLTTEQSQTENE